MESKNLSSITKVVKTIISVRDTKSMKNKEKRTNDVGNEMTREPKTSVPMSKDKEEWKRLRESLVENQSTALTSYPMKVTQLQEITKGLVVEKIKSFLDKLAVIFNEEYIVFKEDGFGWLRKSNDLVPFYKGTEDIIYHDVMSSYKNGNRITKFNEYTYYYSMISNEAKEFYKEKEIAYNNRDRCRMISMGAVQAYYAKHGEGLSIKNEALHKHEIINSIYRNGFYEFYSASWENEKYQGFSIYPYTSHQYSHAGGFAIVITKHVNVSNPNDVLTYALCKFKQPNHPQMTNWDRRLYTLLEQLYKQDVFTETEETTISNFAILKERDKDGVGNTIYTCDEQVVINKLIQLLVDEIEQLKTYDDVVNYLDADARIEHAFFNQSLTSLLEVETTRANIQPYEMDILRDVNKGHWDLFEMLQGDMGDDEVLLSVPKGEVLVARDPLADVNTKVTCAIDFGTKSTVVVYHDRKSSLLRIGSSDQWAEPRMEDYENPTALHIIDYDRFMEDYHSKEGRPPTRWEDMTVSHHAAEKIYQKDIHADVYYSVFNELKQWANAVGRRQLLQDSTGKKIELKAYTTLEDGDFDPIEIYAYYLGLYINNMQHGICVKYYLSFPVNYASDIRDRIIKSFERGIRKSLPERVLNDKETMKRFKVKRGASEPAAYALSALKAYQVEPIDRDTDPSPTYGVFDFGGGTTDFDFGKEYISDDKKFYYEIKQFDNGGDPLLGGENIINILAYEVFKANQQVMRDNKITIVLPNEKCKRFDGSQMLVKDVDSGDQVSYLNLKLLASRLRPIWEEKGDYATEYSTDDVKIDLYNTNKEKKTVPVKVDVSMLQNVIKEHLNDGIDNFMSTFHRAYKGNESEWTWPLHILLAGNSCKSRLLQEQLVIRLLDELDDLDAYLSGERDVSNIFRLYPPLGASFNVEALVKSITDSGIDITEERKHILDTMLYTEKIKDERVTNEVYVQSI